MADTKRAPDAAYSPDMDGPAHEATYRGFVRFAEIGAAVVICWVLALAVGGIKEAWWSAILGVILSAIAGAVGALTNIGWRAPAAVAALLTLLLIVY